MTAPFNAGRAAARAGHPHDHESRPPKPDGPATGEHYPGPWANWMQGWILERSYMKQDATEACIEVCDFLAPVIGAKAMKG